jgi:hypothetical protein
MPASDQPTSPMIAPSSSKLGSGDTRTQLRDLMDTISEVADGVRRHGLRHVDHLPIETVRQVSEAAEVILTVFGDPCIWSQPSAMGEDRLPGECQECGRALVE